MLRTGSYLVKAKVVSGCTCMCMESIKVSTITKDWNQTEKT